jgi:hypothetical protein
LVIFFLKFKAGRRASRHCKGVIFDFVCSLRKFALVDVSMKVQQNLLHYRYRVITCTGLKQWVRLVRIKESTTNEYYEKYILPTL